MLSLFLLPLSSGVIESVLEIQEAGGEWQLLYRGPNKTYKAAKLQPSTAYSLRICDVNESGPGPFSAVLVAKTAPGPDAAVDRPSLLVADDDCVQVSWVAPGDADTLCELQMRRLAGAGDELAFVVAKGGAPSKHPIGLDFAQVYVGSVCELTVGPLTPGAKYEARVRTRADNGVLGKFSEPAQVHVPKEEDEVEKKAREEAERTQEEERKAREAAAAAAVAAAAASPSKIKKPAALVKKEVKCKNLSTYVSVFVAVVAIVLFALMSLELI